MGQTGEMEELKGVIRRLGYRMTLQRQTIIQAIAGSEGHVSAEEIYAELRPHYQRLHISTIYRNLELLKKLGLVTETDLGDGRLRYHYRKKGQHHHLVCQKCGAIIELDEGTVLPLKEILQGKYNFEADLHHLAIFGLCSRCRD